MFWFLLWLVIFAFYTRAWLVDRARPPVSVPARYLRQQRRLLGLSPARAAAIAGVRVARLRAIEAGGVRADRECFLIAWDLRRWADNSAVERAGAR